MAIHLRSKFRGEWLVKVLEANTPALAFWRATIAGFTLGSFEASCKEEGHPVKGRPWVYFRFASIGLAAATAPTPAL